MGLAQYTIVPVQDEWGVLHDGDVKNRYSTKEAAFESAGAAASLAVREGHEVHVSVPGREAGENALGILWDTPSKTLQEAAMTKPREPNGIEPSRSADDIPRGHLRTRGVPGAPD